jgi:superfamily II DNA helicase RecQ
MASAKPITEESFLAVSGVGEAKFKKYGDVFIKIIEEHEEVDIKAGS